MAKKISKKVGGKISVAGASSSSKAKTKKPKAPIKKKSAGKAKRVIKPTKRRDEERK